MFATPPKPALTGAALAAYNDHDAYPLSDPGNWGALAVPMAEYQALFKANPHLAEAMDYDDLVDDQREDIWDMIRLAVINNGAFPVLEPGDYAADVYALTTPGAYDLFLYYTRSEVINIYAAKVSHALYHEINRTFPWQLTEMSEALVRGILDPQELFQTYAPDGDDPGIDSRVSDYSPAATYDTVSNYWGSSTTHAQALSALMNNMWALFFHSDDGTEDPLWVISPTDAWVDPHVPGGDPDERLISRTGCHFISRFAVACARSINIPAFYFSDYWSRGEGQGCGSGHSSSKFPTIDGVLSHGDHCYAGTPYGNLLGIDKLDSLTDWDANIFTISRTGDPCDQLDMHYETLRRQSLKEASNPAPVIRGLFTNTGTYGWSYLETRYSAYLDQGTEMDDLYYDLVTLTGSDGGGGP